MHWTAHTTKGDLAPNVESVKVLKKHLLFKESIHAYMNLYYHYYIHIKNALAWEMKEANQMLALSAHLFPKIIRLYFLHNLCVVLKTIYTK